MKKNITRIKSQDKPDIIETLSDNTYYYNYDITSCKINIINDKQEELIVDGWSFIPIYIKGLQKYEIIVKNIIRYYLTQDEEFDLINSYNKDVLNGLTNSKNIKDYKDYLKLLDIIKNNVKQNLLNNDTRKNN